LNFCRREQSSICKAGKPRTFLRTLSEGALAVTQ
jgi:hypothetical protein